MIDKSVQTNIVIFKRTKYLKSKITDKLKAKGVIISSGFYDNL